jgi:steroid delta-isomerase-like uncharacterized protein
MGFSGREQQRETPSRERGTARESGPAADNARLGRKLYEELWNARDFDGMTRYASEDVECTLVPSNTTMRGRKGYRDFCEGWATAFPDGRVEIKRVTASDDGVVVEFVGRGTHTGPLVGPAGTIPATGRKCELPLCDVLEIEEGAVRRLRSYYDSATMMRQLGLTNWPEAARKPQDFVRIELTKAQQENVKATTGKDTEAIELTVQELEERIAPMPMGGSGNR